MNWARGAVASSYPAVPELLQDLQIGRIDAAVIDAPVAAYLMAQNPSLAAAVEVAVRSSHERSAWVSV
jgi:ABC-type amino acid transport substrate-binding protein